jgi:hypothetical protein
MKNIIILITWIGLSSFSSFQQNTLSSEPLHNTSVLTVTISETKTASLLVAIKAEKLFLKTKGLTDKQFKVQVSKLKSYFKEHLKIKINNQEQPLYLKSISESTLKANVQFQIKSIPDITNMEVFSDCMASMDLHDAISVNVQIKDVNQKYKLNKERTAIVVKFK